jgi:hypothetical protein
LRETISKLVTLQTIDDEVRGHQQERDTLQEKLKRLEELLQLMTLGLTEKESKLSEATRWYKDKDSELKADQEKVVKAKHKLQTVTKNKEYMAMQREIESLRKGNLAREEEILKLLEAAEEFKKSIAAEKARIKELRAELKQEEDANADRIAKLETSISTISSRKESTLAELSPGVVSRYNRIRKARNGVAIIPTHNGACSGCNFSVPPQQLVRVETAKTLESCRNCSRLMYWPPEASEPVQPV